MAGLSEIVPWTASSSPTSMTRFKEYIEYILTTPLPRSIQEPITSFHVRPRRSLKMFAHRMEMLREVIEKIMHRMAMLQHTKYRGDSWQSHWKQVSHQGYDVIRGRTIDYGNREYYVLLGAMCQWSPYCRDIMVFMSWHFPSLHPDADDTSHSIEMQADVM